MNFLRAISDFCIYLFSLFVMSASWSQKRLTQLHLCILYSNDASLLHTLLQSRKIGQFCKAVSTCSVHLFSSYLNWSSFAVNAEASRTNLGSTFFFKLYLIFFSYWDQNELQMARGKNFEFLALEISYHLIHQDRKGR